MAGRTYPAMEAADADRRPLPWSATMPNLEYTSSSSYSSSTHSDITPASHHALNTAYDDLKKRYNELQSRYTQTAKQLRDIQRRGSSPDLPGVTGSPRHHHYHRRSGVAQDLEEPHNGDLGDLTLLSRERDLLERQVSELEHRLTEAGNQLADSEHETRQLREHVSRQEDDLRQNQRLLMHTESENEDLRKRVMQTKRQLRTAEQDKAAGAASAVQSAAHGSHSSQSSSLNSSLDVAPFPGPALGRSYAGGAEGSTLGGELQNVLLTTVSLTSEMKDLRAIIHKQREVILMLIKRQNAERETMKRMKEMQRQEPQTCGIGARPKVRSGALPGAGAAAAGGAVSGPRGQYIQPVACSEDILSPQDHRQDPSNRLGTPALKDIQRSPDRSSRQQAHRPRGLQDRYSAPAALTDPQSGVAPPPSKPAVLVPETLPLENELESHYDDLQFGGGVSVTWERGTGGETNTEDLEPLLPSPPGRLGRNESMEHLHDDSPPYDSVGDLNSTTSGSTLCGTDPETEYEPTEEGYRPMSGGGGSTTSTELENRYRSTGSPLRQRSLNIERNEHRPTGTMPRSYDNTTQNVNLNTSPAEKFGGSETAGASSEQPFLNNNPLVGHKPIPQRNLYPGTNVAARRQSPEPTPPPRRQPRVPVEQASGEDNNATQELRNCPVCNEDFPSHMAMEEFQQHVLECTGRTERICPMCDATFPDEVSQTEFERHVNEHFEDDTTLQFEVLPS